MDVSLHREDLFGMEERKAWKILVRADPSSPALLDLARAYLDKNEPRAALEIADRIRAAHPYHLAAHLLTAGAWVALGDPKQARQILTQTAANLDGLADMFSEMARLYTYVGDEAGAARARRAADAIRDQIEYPSVAEPPEERVSTDTGAVPTETLAALYIAQGHRDKAIEVYRQMLAREPDNEHLKSVLARLQGADTDEKPVEASDTTGEEIIGGETRFSGRATEAGPKEAKQKLTRRLVRLKKAAARRREAVEASSTQD